VDVEALRAVSSATHGQYLSEGIDLAPARSPGGRREISLFPYLLGAALGLFLLDLALRVAKGRSNATS